MFISCCGKVKALDPAHGVGGDTADRVQEGRLQNRKVSLEWQGQQKGKREIRREADGIKLWQKATTTIQTEVAVAILFALKVRMNHQFYIFPFQIISIIFNDLRIRRLLYFQIYFISHYKITQRRFYHITKYPLVNLIGENKIKMKDFFFVARAIQIKCDICDKIICL